MNAFCYAVTWGLSKWGIKMTSSTSLNIPSTFFTGGDQPVNHSHWITEQRQSEISRLQSIWQINSRTQYNCDHIRANCISHRMENHKISLMDFLILSSRNEEFWVGSRRRKINRAIQSHVFEILQCIWESEKLSVLDPLSWTLQEGERKKKEKERVVNSWFGGY